MHYACRGVKLYRQILNFKDRILTHARLPVELLENTFRSLAHPRIQRVAQRITYHVKAQNYKADDGCRIHHVEWITDDAIECIVGLLASRPGAKVLCTDHCGYVFTIGQDGQLSCEEIDRVPDINLEEIPPEQMDEFYQNQLLHLSDDEMISEEGTVLAKHKEIELGSKINAAYFIRDGFKIGAVCYKFDQDDGKCLISDFWVFQPFRSHGAGHFCFEMFEAHCRAAGATAFEVYSEKPAVIRFWKAFGFADDGTKDGNLTRLRLT